MSSSSRCFSMFLALINWRSTFSIAHPYYVGGSIVSELLFGSVADFVAAV
ncbi:hypothetical protein [Providencia alcalifaciens]